MLEILEHQNRVLTEDNRQSENFFESDLLLQHYVQRKVSEDARKLMEEKWQQIGRRAAQEMDSLSLAADKNSPELVKRNFYGEDIDEISFHPAYGKLLEFAVDSWMFRIKWKPELRSKYRGHLHRLGFVSGYIYAMSELGQYCPLCMTDGVARLIDRHGSDEDRERLLPHIATDNPEELFTGAMFLTEKSGGSDVGANLVTATEVEGNYFYLNGEKWFCSNANAELIFALARTNAERKGTKGLSIFLVEKQLSNCERNPMEIIRLKEKLGVRSMASAEIRLKDTVGKLVGHEFEGFRIMTDMINLSRLYNSVAALSGMRRAMAEAYQFLLFRRSFGQRALEHPLIRVKLEELASLYTANFYLVWKAIELLDAADNGDERAANLLRLVTPMAKKESAEQSVYLVRECMELMGGIGYIEDGVMPKIMRDVMVLPIWEGAGNIMILDMLRAIAKSEGLSVMLEEIAREARKEHRWSMPMHRSLGYLQEAIATLSHLNEEQTQVKAKSIFIRLTRLYQMTLILENRDENSAAWIDPAMDYLSRTLAPEHFHAEVPGVKVIEDMIGWQI